MLCFIKRVNATGTVVSQLLLTLEERTRMLADVTAGKLNSERHKEIAEEAVSANNRFLAAASHDLRQPLHAMGLYLDLLEVRIKRDEDLQIMGKLKESTAVLYAMFSRLLDISRLDGEGVEAMYEHTGVMDFCEVFENEFVELAVVTNDSKRCLDKPS